MELEGKTLEGEGISFFVWEVCGAYPDDDVLYVEGVMGNIGVKISTIQAVGAPMMLLALTTLIEAVEKAPCPHCAADGMQDLSRGAVCPYCAGRKVMANVNLPVLERAWQLAKSITGGEVKVGAFAAPVEKPDINLCQCGTVKLAEDELCPDCADDAADELEQGQ